MARKRCSQSRSDLQLRARLRFVVGALVSVGLHLVVLLMLVRTSDSQEQVLEAGGRAAARVMEATLIHLAPLQPMIPPPVVSTTLPEKKTTLPRKLKKPLAPAPLPEIAQPLPQQAPDMMSMLNAARLRRQQAASSLVPKEERVDDIVTENLSRSLREQGGRHNGVFQLISKGPRMARYSFMGWMGAHGNADRRVIEVDAGPGGNVEMAIIDSMISLIRQYHHDEFHWQSARLGRVVVLSARVSDTNELRTFLYQEFFSG